MNWMAEVATNGISPETVGMIIAAMVSGLLGGGGGVLLGKRMRTSTTIEGQPVDVRFADQFVTRREFDQFRQDMRGEVKEIKGMVMMINQTISNTADKLKEDLKETVESLTHKIGETSQNAYEGRQRIWEQVNSQRERIAGIEKTCEAMHKPLPPLPSANHRKNTGG